MIVTNKNINKNIKKDDVLYNSISVLAELTQKNADKLINNLNTKNTNTYLYKGYNWFLRKLTR